MLASSTLSTSPTEGGGSHSRLAVRRWPLTLIRRSRRPPSRVSPSRIPSTGTGEASSGPSDSTHRPGQTVPPVRCVRSPSFILLFLFNLYHCRDLGASARPPFRRSLVPIHAGDPGAHPGRALQPGAARGARG